MSLFFGQRSSQREAFLEEAFLLQYHLNMSYSDVRSMPISYRRWFLSQKKLESQGEPGRQTTQEIPMGEVMEKLASRQAQPKKSQTPKKFK